MYAAEEETIEQLPGVISCKIVPDEDEIARVHVLAKQQEDIPKVIEEIRTIVLVKQDYKLPTEDIKIAQIEEKLEEEHPNRIEIVSIYKEKGAPVCYLKLKINNKVIEEKVSGEADDGSFFFKVVETILEIIEREVKLSGDLELNEVFMAGEEEEIIIVEITMKTNKNGSGNQYDLIGAAYIDFNLPLACGKACLKALNRQLSVCL